VVALSLLIAVRQGRSHADAARLDVRALQARQHDSRVQVGASWKRGFQVLTNLAASACLWAYQVADTTFTFKSAAVAHELDPHHS